MGQVLAGKGLGVTPGARRHDYWLREHLRSAFGDSGGAALKELRAAYHVRCKSDTEDRERDVVAMEAVHRAKAAGLW